MSRPGPAGWHDELQNKKLVLLADLLPGLQSDWPTDDTILFDDCQMGRWLVEFPSLAALIILKYLGMRDIENLRHSKLQTEKERDGESE